MRAVLERHGGTVEKFIGDAVVAVFGVPTVKAIDMTQRTRPSMEKSPGRLTGWRLSVLLTDEHRYTRLLAAVLLLIATASGVGALMRRDPVVGMLYKGFSKRTSVSSTSIGAPRSSILPLTRRGGSSVWW
jgi:hypothetical protein